MKTDFPTTDTRNPVVRVVAIWQPAEGNGLDGLPTRGFAGQILFFTRSSPSPVKVNGDLRVYLFDDVGTAEERSKPIHQFEFSKEAWNQHLTDSTVGVAYTVFIPYVRKHHYEAKCSLRVRLLPGNGPVVYSEAATVILDGPKRNAPTQAAPPADRASSLDAPEAGNLPQLDRELTQRLNDLVSRNSPSQQRKAALRSVPSGSSPSAEMPMIQQASAFLPESQDDVVHTRLNRMEQLLEQLLESNVARAAEPRNPPEQWSLPTAGPDAYTEPPQRSAAIGQRGINADWHRDQSAVAVEQIHHNANPRPPGQPLDAGRSVPRRIDGHRWESIEGSLDSAPAETATGLPQQKWYPLDEDAGRPLTLRASRTQPPPSDRRFRLTPAAADAGWVR